MTELRKQLIALATEAGDTEAAAHYTTERRSTRQELQARVNYYRTH